MSNYTDLIKAMKKASLEAVESSKPVNVVFGKVTSASPLKIQVDQKITLTTAQLVLCRNVTDYDDYITIDSEKKKMTVHNKLKQGEEVILIRQQSGQKYIVIDRLG